MPTYFISHGGGPWPWMPDWRAMFGNLEASFVQMVRDLPRTPEGHPDDFGPLGGGEFAVHVSAHPPMVYDYSGFPRDVHRSPTPPPARPSWPPARPS